MKLTWSAIVIALILSVGGIAHADDYTELQAAIEAQNLRVEARAHENWRAEADALEHVEVAKLCKETTIQLLAKKYAISFDKTTGQACRLYDLSFPTLETVVRSFKFSALPTQKYTARDYINFLNGRFDAVNARMRAYQGPHNQGRRFYSSDAAVDEVETADWVYQLEVKSENGYTNYAAGPRRLPLSFRASDLNIGRDFFFAIGDRQRLRGLIAILAESGAPDSTIAAWNDVVENPKSFLSKIKFNWNDARKVYDIALEGDFLPIMGPVALVDYQRPHKPAVEAIIRGLIGSALFELSGFIPELVVRQIVRLAVEDAFAFIDMAYKYQYNQLEGTLRSTAPTISGGIDGKLMQQTIDLVFGNQADVLTAYITAISQQQKFDMISTARRTRYQFEKARDMNMNTVHNRLVVKKKCKVAEFQTYFTQCTVGQNRGVYSLLSSTQVSYWNLGAPLIYSYNRPSSTALRRGVSYLLSVGIRLVDIGIPKRLRDELITVTTSLARAGVADEAFLKNSLWAMKQNAGMLSMEDQKLLKMLYIQHLNPFLPFSEAQEAKYIETNKRMLKISETAQPVHP